MTSIKNLAFALVIAFMISCTQHNKAVNPTTAKSNNDKVVRLVGSELFKVIRDTVRVQPITTALLADNDWEFYPGEKCVSSYSFNADFKGTGYDCEVMDEFEVKYQITKDTLNVEQYERANIDTENNMIKTRDDKYVYNGTSLIMIDSKMYSNNKIWTPEIEVVIIYHRKKY